MIGANPRDQQVPDVTGQVRDDAIATLQNRGFKVRPNLQPDSKVPPDRVINTTPSADTSVAAGDEITINVSTGPEQREVPDVSNLSPADAENKLKQAGFENVKQSPSASLPEQKGRVLLTNPPANSTSAITNLITIVVGSGPDSRPVPVVKDQTFDVAKQILNASGLPAGHPRRRGQHGNRGSGGWHASRSE